MKTIYLKSLPNEKYLSFQNPYFYKVLEVSVDNVQTLTVTKDEIETEKDEDFHEQVSFIKNTLCKDSGCVEITRQEFDAFFIKTVEKINELSKL